MAGAGEVRLRISQGEARKTYMGGGRTMEGDPLRSSPKREAL